MVGRRADGSAVGLVGVGGRDGGCELGEKKIGQEGKRKKTQEGGLSHGTRSLAVA